jgi:plastocyanin
MAARMLLALAAAGQACAADHVVTIEAMGFSPRELVVRQGDTIEWVNKDPFPHDATSTAKGFTTGAIAADGRRKLTVSKTGEFAYRCTLHPMMQGRVTVLPRAQNL